ncbi:acyltransferase family protein [Paraglaciecola sp. 2405UD69-4]|uniref:acyltransferase family protein n=1 Tax=Paraglaciecola sp. 2405UD69-4 TaxID=3391836 RepID=UPI0039C91B78
MKNRIKFIDIAKGISIALVALHHSDVKLYFPELTQTVSLFRMPLFFFLSGIFFSYSSNTKYFILTKADALLKPYFFMLFGILVLHALTGKGSITDEFWGIFYGSSHTLSIITLWFLSHLFIVYLYAYIVFRGLKFDRFSKIYQYLFIFGTMLAGIISIGFFWQKEIQIMGTPYTLLGLPFSIDITLITGSYFIAGYLMKSYFAKFKPNIFICIASILILVAIWGFSDAKLDLAERIYSSPLYALMGSICGIYAAISISFGISKYKWLSTVPLRMGEASLFILIFHMFIYANTMKVMTILIPKPEKNILMLVEVFCYLLSVFLPIIIRKIVVSNDVLAMGFLPFKNNKLFKKLSNT